jgi:hypothetical protein
MEQVVFKRFIKYILVLVFLTLIVWFGFVVYKSSTFYVVRTDPVPKQVTVISPFFDIETNKTLSNKVVVSSVPAIINSYKVVGKEITTTLDIPLSPNKTYSITVSNIYDTGGKHLADQKFIFTPQKVSSNRLPSDQSQVLLENQTQYSESVYNKLVQLLPFTGPGFEYQISYTVQYATQSNSLVIQITSPNTQGQQAALAWIKSQGYTPAKLNIQYIVTAVP